MTSEEILKNISIVQGDRDKWSSSLMKLNGDLVTAKGSAKRRISSAIKNAEQQLNDLDKRLRKLDQDLNQVAKTEVKQESKNILAEKGISSGAEIVKTIGGTIQSVTQSLTTNSEGSILSKKIDATTEEKKTFFEKYKYFIFGGAGLIVLLLIFKKK